MNFFTLRVILTLRVRYNNPLCEFFDIESNFDIKGCHKGVM